ncbi:unnamed protein product [Rhizoctonia solani]|uniref:Uncharacterized protein n=1 Tax=Rhizoctonia solani TaxID=456999 RepID=A0A8H3H5K9_9AGAM|nr:unnamed protein product [Rhizoctonia solani]
MFSINLGPRDSATLVFGPSSIPGFRFSGVQDFKLAFEPTYPRIGTMAYPAPQSSTSVSPASSIDDLRSEISYDSEEEEQRLAQQEWDESVQQLQLLLTVVVFPFFGKWLGRKWSHILFERYQTLGLGKRFLGLDVLEQRLRS